MVSYSPSISITMAVSRTGVEIFSVKEWRDYENWVRGRSRSLKMATFDRPYTTFYWSAIVSIAVSCTIYELLTLNNIVALNSRLGVTQRHWKWHHLKACVRFHNNYSVSVSPKKPDRYN